MCIIHSLPPCMHTLQTILIRSAPPSSKAVWDLDKLKKDIEANELHAWAAGECLGTKLDLVCDPNVLNVDDSRKGKRKDPEDPAWLAQQTCWACGKVGHICQKCSATQGERCLPQERGHRRCQGECHGT